MALCPLTSNQVLEFLPLNTWTEVHLQPSYFKNVYFVTTKDKMEKRMKDMQLISLHSSFYNKVTQFKLYEIVAVEIDGEWFRGKLIGFNEFRTNSTIIQLIDSGNIYETKLENLFFLPYFFMYEPLALPVTFKDFIPKKTTFSIKPLLSESNLYEGAVLVDVNYNDTKLENCVNEKQLLESKKDINSADDSKMINVKSNITNGHDNIESRKSSFISKEKPNNVSLRNEDYCILTYFEDFTCLYVGKAIKCDNTGSYDFVDYDMIRNTSLSTDKIPKYNPIVGDMVKVFSSQNHGVYYRARILKKNIESYEVFLIDFGNIETVPPNIIYELADELKKPGIAVKIGLSDLKDTRATQQMYDMFNRFCDIEKPFVIEFNENSKNCLENVKLKDIENGSYINSEYLMKYTSTQTEESIQKPQNITEQETVLINIPELEVHVDVNNCNDTKLENCVNEKQLLDSKRDINSADDSKMINVKSNITNGHDNIESRKSSFISKEKPNNVSLRNEDYCILTYFEDFTCLYVGKAIKCDNTGSYKFVECDTILNTAISTDKILKCDPVVGDMVKVFSSQNDGLYRARIEKINKDSYEVFYIDFGNIETVPSNVIYELDDELKKPGIAVKIGLSDLKDTQATQQIIDMFNTFCDIGKPFVIEFNENTKNCLENVKLKDIENGSYINSEYLMKCTSTQTEESIQKPQNITEQEAVLINIPELDILPNFELRTGETVFCTHFEDFNHIYICKCSKNNTTPDNYSVILSSEMTNDIILKKDPKYKDIVRVKFEENIFRAVVLDKCGERYSVFLIDIGKYIDVLGSNIYELPNCLKNIPGLALKVGLKGTTDLKITTAVKNYFYNLWQKDPIPLILSFDEFNFNYLNEVSLKKLSSGQDIIDDLVKMYSTSDETKNKLILTTSNNSQATKSNGLNGVSNNWHSGDHVEFLFGKNVHKMFVKNIKLYEEFKNVLYELKKENIEHYKPIAAKTNDFVAVYSTKNNGGIYRAKVVLPASDNTNMVKCSLIDLCEIDMIPSKHVFSLPNHVLLNKVPTIIRRVSLIGVQKISNSKIIPYLSSLRGKTYVMEYDKSPGWRNKEVVLKELQSGVSLNDEIQKLY